MSEQRSHADAFFSLINSPLKRRLFLLSKLPAAYFSGVKILSANSETCAVSVPYQWFTKNPFRSTYFACLSMAAEMSTGVLAMANTFRRKPSVSMLITGMESSFHKKATGTTIFYCHEGLAIQQAVEKAVAGALAQTIRVQANGFNEQKQLVAEFWFTWSFKLKQ